MSSDHTVGHNCAGVLCPKDMCADGKPRRTIHGDCCMCPEKNHPGPKKHLIMPCVVFGKGMCNLMPMCTFDGRMCTQDMGPTMK